MNMFHPDYASAGDGGRLSGLDRYKEVIGRDHRKFFLANLMTALCFLPFAIGVLLSVSTSSLLLLIPLCALSGLLAGPGLACMYDIILRSLRDAGGTFPEEYRHAWIQNARQAMIPGMIFCLLTGLQLFMIGMFSWASRTPSAGTLIVYLLGVFIVMVFFLTYWPQLVLFDQKNSIRLQNSLLFLLKYRTKILIAALVKFAFWIIVIVLMPWSFFLIPVIGFWWPDLVAMHLLYPALDSSFHIEDSIRKAFPGQIPEYETDEEWVERMQKEESEEHAEAIRRKSSHTD